MLSLREKAAVVPCDHTVWMLEKKGSKYRMCELLVDKPCGSLGDESSMLQMSQRQ